MQKDNTNVYTLQQQKEDINLTMLIDYSFGTEFFLCKWGFESPDPL